MALIIPTGAVLPGPLVHAAGVVFANKRIGPTGVGPSEAASGIARNVDISYSIRRYSSDPVCATRSELPRPLERAACIVLADKRIPATGVGAH